MVGRRVVETVGRLAVCSVELKVGRSVVETVDLWVGKMVVRKVDCWVEWTADQTVCSKVESMAWK